MAQRDSAAWSAHELAAFLERNRDHDHFVALAAGAFTGMRRGELLALRWRDIDLDADTVQVGRTLAFGQRFVWGLGRAPRWPMTGQGCGTATVGVDLR